MNESLKFLLMVLCFIIIFGGIRVLVHIVTKPPTAEDLEWLKRRRDKHD